MWNDNCLAVTILVDSIYHPLKAHQGKAESRLWMAYVYYQLITCFDSETDLITFEMG